MRSRRIFCGYNRFIRDLDVGVSEVEAAWTNSSTHCIVLLCLRYHPHYHGSGGMQTATAHGTIIVEDEPEDGLPEWLTNAPEKILMFTAHPAEVNFWL